MAKTMACLQAFPLSRPNYLPLPFRTPTTQASYRESTVHRNTSICIASYRIERTLIYIFCGHVLELIATGIFYALKKQSLSFQNVLSKLWTTNRLRVVPILKYARIRAVTTHALATRSTWLLKYSCLQIFEQKRDCSQSIVCKELIITCNRARVRKSCYRLILRLRHHILIVHSRSTLVNVYSLLYEDIYSVQIWRTGFRRV